MWLGMLQNCHPELMAKIQAYLRKLVDRAEKRYNGTPGSYWYRAARPDDPGLGGTAKTYTWTLSDATEEHYLAQAAAITVPNANMYVSFGWYIDADLGAPGYVLSKKQNVTKSEIPARNIYEQKDPAHMLLDFDHILVGEEQELIDFVFYCDHDSTNDQICMASPILFRIATRSALNLEEPV